MMRIPAVLMLLLASSATAQRPFTPVGEYTLVATRGNDSMMGVLTIALQNGALVGRIVLPGQTPLDLPNVTVDNRTVTMRQITQGVEMRMMITFATDSTFIGSWSLGGDNGTLSGQRGVSARAVEPTCAPLPPSAAPPSMAVRKPTPNPDSARIITSDVRLFWSLVDRSTPETLPELLHCEYLRYGTEAVRDFIPGRIISGLRLAEMVTTRRERYEAARQSTLKIDTMESAIRRVFAQMKAAYPEAVFPDVYFVIGRLNTGGTVSQRGLLIGTEMYVEHGGIPGIVAHELVHYQQKPMQGERTLLAQSVMEGSADFVAEVVTGRHINSRAHEYALPRERELWQEFSQVMNGREFRGWLYGGAPEGRPADIGYFFGYRIAQAYYNRMGANREALRRILAIGDYPELLRQSGYNPLN